MLLRDFRFIPVTAAERFGYIRIGSAAPLGFGTKPFNSNDIDLYLFDGIAYNKVRIDLFVYRKYDRTVRKTFK